MVLSRRDSGDTADQAADVHRRGAGYGRAVAQLTSAIPPPAHDTATAGQCTSVVLSRRDSSDAADQAADIHRRGAGYGRAIAQLTRAIPPPALNAPTTDQRTGVVVSRRNSGNAAGQAAHIYGCAAGCPRTVAQTAGSILPPAHDTPAADQRTGVFPSCRDSGDISDQAADVCGRGAGCERAAAQLTVEIIPPAHDAPATDQRTGVVASRRDSGDAAGQSAHIYGRAAGCPCAVA